MVAVNVWETTGNTQARPRLSSNLSVQGLIGPYDRGPPGLVTSTVVGDGANIGAQQNR
jgi:hypothetical protein